MSTTFTTPGAGPTPSTTSLKPCENCRRRKVKCDKTEPCGNCVKHRVACVYDCANGSGNGDDSLEKTLLNERVERLERMIEEMSRVNLDQQQRLNAMNRPPLGGLRNAMNGGDLVGEDHGVQIFEPHVCYHMAPSFWMNLHESIHEPRYMCRPGYEDKAGETECLGIWSWPFLCRSAAGPTASLGGGGLAALHLPLDKEDFLLEYQLKHVEPFMRIIHISTVRTYVADFRRGASRMDRDVEAAMFALQYIAVVAMPGHLVEPMLGQGKHVLLSHLRRATEAALSRANLLISRKVVLFQALLYYLVS